MNVDLAMFSKAIIFEQVLPHAQRTFATEIEQRIQKSDRTLEVIVRNVSSQACWLTTQPEATLSSLQEFNTFSRVDIFIQFSNKSQCVLHVGCDKGEIGRINTTWEFHGTLVNRHTFKNDDSSFTCDGKLHIVAKNNNSTAEAPVETKVCGVVVQK